MRNIFTTLVERIGVGGNTYYPVDVGYLKNKYGHAQKQHWLLLRRDRGVIDKR